MIDAPDGISKMYEIYNPLIIKINENPLAKKMILLKVFEKSFAIAVGRVKSAMIKIIPTSLTRAIIAMAIRINKV
jgi:hypothetical protein